MHNMNEQEKFVRDLLSKIETIRGWIKIARTSHSTLTLHESFEVISRTVTEIEEALLRLDVPIYSEEDEIHTTKIYLKEEN
jgi:hypothetical protein